MDRRLQLLLFASVASASTALAQEPLDDGMKDPFVSGMPDMPVGMPDMPDVGDMPELVEVPELGGMPEFDDMPVAAPKVQPPARKPSSLNEKREVLRAELDKLSPSDQRQLRRALREVWSNQKVLEARTAYREAGQRYQRALYSAMLEQDGQLRPFLERLLQAGLHMPLRQVAPHVQVARLFEVPDHHFETNKEAITDAFTQASQAPEVLEIRVQLQQTTPDNQDELNQKLRAALRSAILEALPAMHDWIEEPSELSA